MDVITQWWPYLLAAVALGSAFGYWVRRAGAYGAAGPADAGTGGTAAEEADVPHQPPAGIEAERDRETQRAVHAETELSELRQEREPLQADLSGRVGELEALLRERDQRIATLSAAHAAQPARVAFSSEPAISRDEVDTLFAEIIEARKAMKAAEQEAHRREEEVAAELAEAYAELQAASAAIRMREQRLSGELEEARRELEEAADRLAATHAVEQALRGELDQSLAAETSARRQAQELLEENARLSVAFKELEARLSSSMQTELALRAELEIVGGGQAGRGRELEGLRVELEDTRRALAAASARGQEQQEVSAELRAQLTEARSRLATIAGEEHGLREELTESHRLAAAAAEREASLRLELDRAGQSIAGLQASAAPAAAVERPIPFAADVDRREVPAGEDRDARDTGAAAATGAPSTVAGLSAEELERLVLDAGEGSRPAGRELADGQRPDDLKAIGGIGPVNERWLHRNGIYFYAQVAQWSPEELAWVARHLPNFGKRVYRENWVRQAAELARPDVMPEQQGKRLRADRH